MNFYCYLLESPGKTYIGATVDPNRRLQQHNGEKSGGARATKGRTWNRVLYVSGFPDWTAALQFEWAWKRFGRGRKGTFGKIDGLLALLQNKKSTSSSLPYMYWQQGPIVHITTESKKVSEKIDGSELHLVDSAVTNHNTLSKAFCLFPPNTFLPKMSVSNSDVSTIVQAIETLTADVAQMNTEVAAIVAPAVTKAKKPRAKKAAVAETAAPTAETTAEVKPKAVRKPRAKKADAPAAETAAPAAAEPVAKKARKPRAKKADAPIAETAAPAVETAAPAVAEPVAKKARKPRAKKADAPAAETAAPAVETAAPVATEPAAKKVRKPRAKKVDAPAAETAAPVATEPVAEPAAKKARKPRAKKEAPATPVAAAETPAPPATPVVAEAPAAPKKVVRKAKAAAPEATA